MNIIGEVTMIRVDKEMDCNSISIKLKNVDVHVGDIVNIDGGKDNKLFFYINSFHIDGEEVMAEAEQVGHRDELLINHGTRELTDMLYNEVYHSDKVSKEVEDILSFKGVTKL